MDVFATGGRAGGVRTLLQPARAQRLRLSGRFFHFYSISYVALVSIFPSQFTYVIEMVKPRTGAPIRYICDRIMIRIHEFLTNFLPLRYRARVVFVGKVGEGDEIEWP